MYLVKGRLLFKVKYTAVQLFGKRISISMDCYETGGAHEKFEERYTFSWIAFDPNDHDQRVLMDQHKNRPCHLHIGEENMTIPIHVNSIGEANVIFWEEVRRFFGELEIL